MGEHLLHVYTGDGKGKTTAAMGLALRVLGHGGKALLAQFMKDGTSGELASLAGLAGAEVFPGLRMDGFIWRMGEERLERERARVAGAATLLEARVHELMPDLLVLDEACVALAVRMLSREDAERLIEAGLRYGDVVLTGRDAPQWLLDRAAYVTRMEAVKHPFDEGRPARKGIEF